MFWLTLQMRGVTVKPLRSRVIELIYLRWVPFIIFLYWKEESRLFSLLYLLPIVSYFRFNAIVGNVNNKSKLKSSVNIMQCLYCQQQLHRFHICEFITFFLALPRPLRHHRSILLFKVYHSHQIGPFMSFQAPRNQCKKSHPLTLKHINDGRKWWKIKMENNDGNELPPWP